ncbi:hypothetical protein PN499_00610 [Kamptonema animale CS-326]|jgi:hypothetical protein|uniref:hypothetical protein n=1 Tax=Kamptonema animale TaxID=92934 RepID=UPI00232BBA64|nr:hypothetical protein [Kamptonema animale]MDB9509706.1 hypothetical protein [Kamptonema animale CS-326]
MKCDESFCNWVRNSQDADHYICLKCDKEKHINRSEPMLTFIIIFAIALTIVIVLN